MRKGRPGRPMTEINWETVDMMLKAHCVGTEIAAYMGIHPDTLYKACQRDHKMVFSAYSQEKQSVGKAMLKVRQFEMAIGKGNTPADKGMLIWLGKQYLDQSDKKEVDHSTQGEKITGLEVVIRGDAKVVNSENDIDENI